MSALAWLGMGLYVAGVASGVWLTMLFRATFREMEASSHDATVEMQGKEIARLRAQVALLIGKDK